MTQKSPKKSVLTHDDYISIIKTVALRLRTQNNEQIDICRSAPKLNTILDYALMRMDEAYINLYNSIIKAIEYELQVHDNPPKRKQIRKQGTKRIRKLHKNNKQGEDV